MDRFKILKNPNRRAVSSIDKDAEIMKIYQEGIDILAKDLQKPVRLRGRMSHLTMIDDFPVVTFKRPDAPSSFSELLKTKEGRAALAQTKQNREATKGYGSI
jgi:hypothetical protein